MKSGREAACLSRPKGVLPVETTDRLEACLPYEPRWLFSKSLRYLKSRNALGRAFRVALMIFFRAPEFRSGFNLGDDRTAKAPALVQLFLGNFCCCLLL